MAGIEDIFEFRQLLPKFKEAFLHGSSQRFRWQRSSLKNDGLPDGETLSYTKVVNRAITNEDFEEHFSQTPIFRGEVVTGSMSICGLFEGDICKWNCLDCDTPEETYDISMKVVPILKSDYYKIPHIIEWTKADQSKLHLWIPCNTVITPLRLLMEQIFKDAKLDVHEYEAYPSHLPNSFIRVPAGIHLKRNEISQIEWDGILSSDPTHVIRSFIECAN